ncbi:MAG: VirD4-like conjugal transfer protein, CD1115 family [Flammeovirgaceae bacterium]
MKSIAIHAFWLSWWLLELLSTLFFVKPTTAFGSATYLSKRKRWQLLSRYNQGLLINGKHAINQTNSFKHLYVLGKSGSGKTTTFLLPNVIVNQGVSKVVFDPSSEIYNQTAPYLKKSKVRVKLFDVSRVAASLKYNPLARASNVSEMKKIAEIIICSAFPDTESGTSFWNNGAQSLLAIPIQALKESPIHEANLSEIRRFINMIGVEKEEDKLTRLILQAQSDSLLKEYLAFQAQEDKIKWGIVATVKAALHKFADPQLAELTSDDTITFEDLRKEPTVLFIRVPEEQVLYYSFLIALLYTDLFNFFMSLPQKGKPYLPVYMLMDEFANSSGKIPSFANIITVLRKRKVSVSIVIQDLSQLFKIYGKEDALTILNGGISNQVILPGVSHEVSNELSAMLGQKTILHAEQSFGNTTVGREKEMARPLLTPDEIRCIPNDQLLFISGNSRPCLLKSYPYYSRWKMMKRIKQDNLLITLLGVCKVKLTRWLEGLGI